MIRLVVILALFASVIGGASLLFFNGSTNAILGINTGPEKTYQGYLTRTNANRCLKSGGKICYAIYDARGRLITYVAKDNLRKSLVSPLIGRAVEVTGTKQQQKNDSYLSVTKISLTSSKTPLPKNPGTKVVIGLAGYTPSTLDSTETDDAGYMVKGTSAEWENIEPHMAKDSQDYNFAAFGGTDKQVEDCNRNGVPCDLLIAAAPPWAVTKSIQSIKDANHNQGYVCLRGPYDMNPNDPHDVQVMEHYKTFIKMLFERYNGKTLVTIDKGLLSERTITLKVTTFIPNNEPDYYHPDCGQSPWGTDMDLNKNGKPDYQDFSDVQRIFYKVAKSVDNPGIQIAYGNLGNFDIMDMRYTRQFGSDDTKTFFYKTLKYLNDTTPTNERNLYPFFDSVSLHGYMLYHCNAPFPDAEKDYYFDKNTLSNYTVGGLRGNVMWVNRVMKANGTSRPVWFGEYGYPTQYKEGSYPEHVMGLSAFKMTVEALASPNVSMVKWYDLGYGDSQYGLLDRTKTGPINGYRRRPAWFAYHTLVTELDGYWFRFLDKSNPKNLEGYIFTPSPETSEADITNGEVTYKEALWSVPDRPTFCPPPNYDPNNAWSSWAWAADPRVAPNIKKKFVATKITTQTPYGDEQTILDGGAGDLDGRKNGSIMIELKSIKFYDPDVPPAQKNHPMTPAIPLLVTVTN